MRSKRKIVNPHLCVSLYLELKYNRQVNILTLISDDRMLVNTSTCYSIRFKTVMPSYS